MSDRRLSIFANCFVLITPVVNEGPGDYGRYRTKLHHGLAVFVLPDMGYKIAEACHAEVAFHLLSPHPELVRQQETERILKDRVLR